MSNIVLPEVATGWFLSSTCFQIHLFFHMLVRNQILNERKQQGPCHWTWNKTFRVEHKIFMTTWRESNVTAPLTHYWHAEIKDSGSFGKTTHCGRKGHLLRRMCSKSCICCKSKCLQLVECTGLNLSTEYCTCFHLGAQCRAWKTSSLIIFGQGGQLSLHIAESQGCRVVYCGITKGHRS